MSGGHTHSINDAATKLVSELVHHAHALRVSPSRGERGEQLIDAGAEVAGGIEAGVRIAEICMGGLGHVDIAPDYSSMHWPWRLAVRSSQPAIACLGSQYAGWSLSHGEGKSAYYAMGSGPARALAQKEEIFRDIHFRDTSRHATIVLETDKPPPAEIIDKLTQDCHVNAEQLNVIYAPTQSLAGTVQVVARVLEVALHKAHALKFSLPDIVDGLASAPLCPPHPDFVTAMGRTNDAIIYGGQVQLFVKGPASAARQLAEELPSQASRDYGKPFAQVFRDFKGDFYAIDPMLFSPAAVMITALENGETYRSGAINPDLLDASFA
jgi:methenyltetrahydromethanopterin cyclohydrolase